MSKKESKGDLMEKPIIEINPHNSLTIVEKKEEDVDWREEIPDVRLTKEDKVEMKV